MKNEKLPFELAVIGVIMVPFIYLVLVFKSLPEMVPTHFSIEGTPDNFSSKTTLIFILIALNLFIYGLFYFIPQLSPNKFEKISPKTYKRIRLGFSIFIAALSCLMIYLADGDPLTGIRILALVFALLAIFLGNYMQVIRTNYFIGIRTPWSLSNEENWKLTHKLTGRLLFYSGIISGLFAFILPAKYAPFPSVGALVISLIIGFIYSFYLFKKSPNKSSSTL